MQLSYILPETPTIHIPNKQSISVLRVIGKSSLWHIPKLIMFHVRPLKLKLVLDSAQKTGWLSKGIIYERNFRSLQSGILNDINTCFDHQILDALPK